MSKTSSAVVLAVVLLSALAVSASGQASWTAQLRPFEQRPQPEQRPLEPMPVQVTTRLEALQAEIAQLQARVKRLEAHSHRFSYGTYQVNSWMSIGELRDAMQPHSPLDINAWWIPLQAARGAAKLGSRAEDQTSLPVYP